MHRLAELRPHATTLLIAGLGYFVDLFDLTLFGVVRSASLRELGVASSLDAGLLIYNAQMAGLVAGGVLWGVLADRYGRRTVLIGSILLYSCASLLSAAVQGVTMYALARFLCGIGLAGEVGAAIVLVSESLPTPLRGIGTTIVTVLGLLGVTAAAVVGSVVPWRTAYLLGGVMGLALLLGRVRIAESPLFARVASWRIPWGGWRAPGIARRLVACIAIGVPMYFTTSVMLTFSPEIAAGLGVPVPVLAGRAVLIGSLGLACGDLLAGLLSQQLQRRKRVLVLFLLVSVGLLLLMPFAAPSATRYYVWIGALCVASGYWTVLVTLAAEQFGTNVRGAMTTMIPNLVRGSALLAATAFASLRGTMSVPTAALWVGGSCLVVALVAVTALDESFSRDLDFVES